MKKNTKWLLENKTNYEKIFEDKREKIILSYFFKI